MSEGHDFAWAFSELKKRNKVCRRGWQHGMDSVLYLSLYTRRDGTSPAIVRTHLVEGVERSVQNYEMNTLDTMATDWVLYDNGDSQDAPTTNLTFGQALELLKQNKRVGREGWNGKGQYVEFVLQAGFGYKTVVEKFLILKNAQGRFNTWVPSIGDLFSEDWMVVE